MPPWHSVVWDKLLTIYGRWLPYHPGKWWIVFKLEDKARGSWTGPRIIEYQGMKYELDLRRRLERRMFYLNWHERSETRFLKRLVKPGWTVVDIGANFGYYAVLFARLVGPSGCVYAFEAASSNYQVLVRNIVLNDVTNIQAYRKAVGDSSGETSLMLECFDHPEKARIANRNEQGSESVPVTTFDQFVEAEKLRRLDLIKVDIEGSESRFLTGAQKTLRQFRPIMMIEIHPRELGVFGSSVGEFARGLAEGGYTLYRLGWRGALRPLREPYAVTNWLNAIALPN